MPEPEATVRGRVLVAAGEWGFGPAVTAELIVSRLVGDAEVDLLVEGGAREYAAVSRILTRCRSRALDELSQEYDLVVSVLEPGSLVWAKKHSVPAVAVDNIYWHWTWDQEVLDEAERILVAGSEVGQTLDELRALGGYAEYASMYLVADRVLCQKVAPPNIDLPKWVRDKALVIHPMTRSVSAPSKRDQVLISMSGGLVNPAADEQDWDTYLRVLEHVTSPGVCLAQENGWHVEVAAPEVLRAAATDVLGIDARAHDHESFLTEVARSKVVAAPMGLSTTIEAAVLGAALFTLPELHDGNYSNYTGLGAVAGLDGRALDQAFPSAQLGADGRTRSVAELFADYRDALSCPAGSMLDAGRHRFENFVAECLHDAGVDTHRRRQRAMVERGTGGFDGLDHAWDHVSHVLARARGTRRRALVDSLERSASREGLGR